VKALLYQERKGIAWITLNRPQALNALSEELLRQLAAVLDEVKANEAVKTAIITGSGDKAFSAGADIEFLGRASALEVREFARLAVSVNHRIETLGKVVVAAINGYALGGGLELAEACTLRVAARHGNLLSETENLVSEILSKSPSAVRLTWEAMHRGLNLTLEESTLLGADYFGLAAATEDFLTGTRSFLEKTTPSFSGR
jgi:enoyl-CoA hydratase